MIEIESARNRRCKSGVKTAGVKGLFGAIGLAVLLACTGCHVLSPKPIPSSPLYLPPPLVADADSQIEVGRPVKWLDVAGWVWGIPSKVLLWDSRIDRHRFTEPTIETTAEYLQANQLAHIKVRMNQYAPLEDFRRLRKNTTVAWPYRYTLGLLSVGGEAILPGRLIGGDHFNPFTQTVHLYSDVPAIALHELGHAKDFARRKYQGTYALAYLVTPLWHETVASRDALSYLYQRHDRAGIVEANRVLYPAYGTYVGNALGPFSLGHSLPTYYGAVIAGHLNGRMLSRRIDEDLRRYDQMFASRPVHQPVLPTVTPVAWTEQTEIPDFEVDLGDESPAPPTDTDASSKSSCLDDVARPPI
ncbi:hypothetical protein K227x_14160 [Rubripirellula lacrimiformis]|uniref:Uncharacterized protein n=2 Tax=Rubripirellula lacrimiformis TaxID=1930273 RepID=A0A517N7B3_9BACT|nr:hypothetical protein K227x_14160 [Rubripirellula lacrimiformis]